MTPEDRQAGSRRAGARPDMGRGASDVVEAEAIPAHGGATLASSVYERLRDDILRGVLKPGEKLRVEFLRERYGAGSSPIREALNRLGADGLVEREDQKGFRAARVSAADLVELIKTRCWLEELALRESIRHGGPDWEEGIVLAYHRLSRVPRSESEREYVGNPEWEKLHRDFHMKLIDACGSSWLLEYCGQLNDLANRYRQLAMAAAYPERKRSELAEHREIMDATIDRDADKAVACLMAHYRSTVEIILATMPGLAK